MQQHESASSNKRAFEVEDIRSRENFVTVIDGPVVRMYDTSRIPGSMRCKRDLFLEYTEVDGHLQPTEFNEAEIYVIDPHGHTTAEGYFKQLLDSAVGMASLSIMFIGYVDPDTFEEIEQEGDAD